MARRILAAPGPRRNPLRLGPRQPGYRWNPATNRPIAGWPVGIFLPGDEGGDPVVLDPDQPARGIRQPRHGAGNWETGGTVAGTLGQSILCSAPLHHAFTAFGRE